MIKILKFVTIILLITSCGLFEKEWRCTIWIDDPNSYSPMQSSTVTYMAIEMGDAKLDCQLDHPEAEYCVCRD